MKNATNALTSDANRRRFLKKGFTVGTATLGAGLLANNLLGFENDPDDPDDSGSLTRGDAAILRFLAAAEVIESDLWVQYNELGGIQDNERPELGGGGNPIYTTALTQLDSDLPQYIHDNADDELSHADFINAYLASKGADTVDLDRFRNLPSSKASGALNIGRLTNLMELTVDTSWWTRYRSDAHNPDLDPGFTFPQAVPDIFAHRFPAIPRTNADVKADNTKPSGVSDLTQAIANTAGFHFGFIEQGGSSLYPSVAQRVTSRQVLRILLSIGPTETSHFQTWHDKAGNAPPLSVIDPVSKAKITFPNLNTTPGGPNFQTNLIMPEPCPFLSRKFPKCSIIRPTETKGAATGALRALTGDGLFIGQSKEFFELLADLAADADAARRERD